MKKESSNNEFLIIEKIREGDASAFREIVEKYKDVSFSLACSILKNEHEAEDALQDSFIKVYRNIKKFRHESSFSTWLYRIVVNTCLTLAEKRKKIDYHDDDHYPEYDFPADYNTGFDNLIISERKRIVNSAFKSMKPDEALLLRLYYLAEHDIKEIKEITGFTESKIKVVLHRGRKSLFQYLQNIMGKDLKKTL